LPADLLIHDAWIHTLDSGSEGPPAEALAVQGGRVLGVGRTADLEPLVGPGTRRVSLGGRTVIPGLNDAHLHLVAFALSLRRVNLVGVPTLAEGLAKVRAAVERAAPGEWILGNGWDKNLWGGLPTRADLDAVAPGNPVCLASRDLHVEWANTRALELAGVGRETTSPAGGEIVRGADGEPTGILQENAGELVTSAVPPPTPEQVEAALLEALPVAARLGLTSLQTFESAAALSALQRLRERGRLSLRVCCHLWKDSLPHARALGLRTGFGDEWLRLGHLKLFLDGALGSQTAHMLAPYAGTASTGIETLGRQELVSLIREAAEGGIAVAIHAIGDAANRKALDALAETAPLWRPAGLRPRIEHVQLLHPADARRLGELGIVASMQPIHATSDWPVAERYWGERSALAYAWRTVRDSGAVLAFGSDCPVEPLDPWLGLRAAVTREREDGQPRGGWHPEQRLDARAALAAYTVGAAYASGEERLKGSLTPGHLADFVVLSEDPMSSSEATRDARVEATVVGGEVVFGDL
jgi:predicted amidohydrolase YtcJ